VPVGHAQLAEERSWQNCNELLKVCEENVKITAERQARCDLPSRKSHSCDQLAAKVAQIVIEAPQRRVCA